MTKHIFCSYSHKDDKYRLRLETHLAPMKRLGLVMFWHDREIVAGENWQTEIKKHLDAADIIILLVSPDFMASDYCFSVEMKRALERHEAGEAQVVPIIVRPTDWKSSPFASLQVLPTDGKPLSEWRPIDRGLLSVAMGIRKVVETSPLRKAVMKGLFQVLETQKEAEASLTEGQVQIPMNRKRTNALAEFLTGLPTCDPDTVVGPHELGPLETAGKVLDSLGVWPRVGLATRCAARTSSILSSWPLRKHCVDSAIRAARDCAIAGIDPQARGYGRTVERIEELTAIGRAAFDAGKDAACERDGDAPKWAADATGQAVFAARDALRGATTDCAAFAVQLSMDACAAVGKLIEPFGQRQDELRRLPMLVERLPMYAAQADLVWLRTRMSTHGPVPEGFFTREVWTTKDALEPKTDKRRPWWKMW